MRYNNDKNNAYPRRSPVRHQATKKAEFSKRLIEEFLTQFALCVLVIGIIFGAKLLKFTNINDPIAKVQAMITYSPSLKEITEEAKELVSILAERIGSNEKSKVYNQEINRQETPIIIVDDEIF